MACDLFYKACLLSIWFFGVQVEGIDITLDLNPVTYEFPGNVSCGAEVEWNLKVWELGSGVSLVFNETNIDPDNEEHFFFAANRNEPGESSSVAFVTGQQEDLKLAIPLNEAYLRFSYKVVCNENSSFTITLRQLDHRAAEPPKTTPSPYPPAGIKTDILIYLAGLTVNQFENQTLQRDLRQLFQKQAFNYSERHSIDYNPNKLDNETVFFSNPHLCSEKWPDRETCVGVWLQVYVTEPRRPYELSIDHLEELWEEIQAGNLLEPLGIQAYIFPDVAIAILWWVLWLFIAIFITSVIAFVVYKVQHYADDEERQDLINREDRRMAEIGEKYEVQMREKPVVQLPLSNEPMPEYMLSPGQISIVSKPEMTKVSNVSEKLKPAMKFGTLSQHDVKTLPPVFINPEDENEDDDDDDEEEEYEYNNDDGDQTNV